MTRLLASPDHHRVTSTNGNNNHVTGPLWGEFLTQRPMTRSFDIFFDLRLNKRLSKPSIRRWFETPCSLWRHCDEQQRLINVCLLYKTYFPNTVSRCREMIETANKVFSQFSSQMMKYIVSIKILRHMPSCGHCWCGHPGTLSRS